MFTSVPLIETIDLICEYVYDEHNVAKPNFPKSNFKKLLTLAVKGIFMFDSKFYQQIDGVSMGNPLGPSFANIFLAHLEKNYFDHPFAPKSYSRYIDNILCVFSSADNYTDFF